MKKIFYSVITTLMCLSLLQPTAVFADQKSDQEDLQAELNKVIEYYLHEFGVVDMSELNYEETKIVLNALDKIKNNSELIIQAKLEATTKSKLLRASDWQYKGYVFVTGDSKTYGWSHGHAGIGGAISGSTIEAANSSLGVVYRTNRVVDYWSKKNSSIMGVSGATSTQYNTAFSYARARVGLAYGFDPISSGDWYCSELVYHAWLNAGIQLYPHSVGFILPSWIYGGSSLTYTVVKYGTGY